uniref:Uncharacterized protein n=1 Tax=Octopus bimaculoides TaxID=37653 RepID=A0A0L8HCS6_OCTBM
MNLSETIVRTPGMFHVQNIVVNISLITPCTIFIAQTIINIIINQQRTLHILYETKATNQQLKKKQLQDPHSW